MAPLRFGPSRGNERPDFLRVPLSSVDQDSARIGNTAAVVALKLAQGRIEHRSETELIEPPILIRASSPRQVRSR